MKTVKLTDEQVIILKSLLTEEIDYLTNEAIPESLGEDNKEFNNELKACKDLLEQIK